MTRQQRLMESEIFDSDSAPASAEYTPTPKHFKVLDSDSCLNFKANYLKAVVIYTPRWILKFEKTYSYATCDITVTHDESAVGLVDTK